MLVAAENSPIAPMNSSTGMPLRSWTFLKASSDSCRFGDADCAPACTYPGTPHAGERTAARSAVLIEGVADAAARPMDIPVPALTNATPISHTIAAPATTSRIRLDPICMLSPSSSASSQRHYLRGESNPPSAGADAQPEHERHDGHDFQ